MRSIRLNNRGLFLLWLMALLLAVPLLVIAADDEKPAKEDEDDKPRERPAAEEAAEVVIHEWNFWIADPTTERINAADLYPANLPAQVETIRSRKMPPGIVLPSPLAMMTFTGKPVSDIEIDLRVSAGRVLAHWPPGKYKNGRLRWLDYALGENLDEAPALVAPPAEHWFNAARADGLYLRSKARAERFLAYDVELNFNTNLKLAGGPDNYKITNPGPQPLFDVLVSAPTPEGRRIAWLDELPVTKGAAAATPAPVPAPGVTPAPGTDPLAPTAPAPGAGAPPAPAAAAPVRAPVKVEIKAAAANGAAAEAEAKASAQKDAAVKAEAVAKEAAAAQAAIEKQATAAKKDAPAANKEVAKDEAARKAAEAKKEAASDKPSPTPPQTDAKAYAPPVDLAPANPPQANPGNTKPADAKPATVKPAEAKPTETKPAEIKPAEPVGVDVAMSVPLKPGSDEYKAQTTESLKARLVKAGLTEKEADLLLSIYAKHIFESEDLVVIYRVPQTVIDEKLPLAVYPDAKKIVRVGLVLVRNLDPKISSDIQQLVAQLGDVKYPVREKAARRLSALGPLAAPALKEAAKSTDAEVQFRAERILQEQEPDESGQPRNRARAVRVLRAG